MAFVVVLIDGLFEDEGLSTDETFAQDPEVEGSEVVDFEEVDDAGKTDNAGGVELQKLVLERLDSIEKRYRNELRMMLLSLLSSSSSLMLTKTMQVASQIEVFQ